jgi:hypothetical protein
LPDALACHESLLDVLSEAGVLNWPTWPALADRCPGNSLDLQIYHKLPEPIETEDGQASSDQIGLTGFPFSFLFAYTFRCFLSPMA